MRCADGIHLYAICIPNKHYENFHNNVAIWSQETEDRLMSLILIIILISLKSSSRTICDAQARVDSK